jgi:hypothetical protein
MHRITLSIVAAGVLMVPAYAAAQAPAAQPAIVADAYLTPISGALNLMALQHGLASVEDHFLPRKLGDEGTRLGLLAGIGYRTAKFIGLDVPQDHMFLVVQHEVFGHGARLRELGRGHIGYGFDVPIPYGPGGGVTRFDGEFPDSPLAVLAIESSGIEGQHTLADAIAARALSRGRIQYREAWLYFESRYIAATYILNATDFAKEGHDVADFVRTMAETCEPPLCHPITLSDLQRGAKWMLTDPLLYFSLYGFASSYMGLGQPTSPIPMLPLGRRVRYLPSVGFQMTPYGTEYSVRAAMVARDREEGSGKREDDGRKRVTTVVVRVGNTGATRPWGIDVHSSGIRVPRTRWRVDPSLSVWRQPFILAQLTSAPLETGVAAAATFVVPLPHTLRVARLNGIYVTAGVKSDGFVPGEQLSGGAVFRAGLTLRPFD